MKAKENKKPGKISKTRRIDKKAMDHEGNGDTNNRALGTISKIPEKRLEELEISVRIKIPQTTVLLGWATVLKKARRT